jgi:two-component system chemotaxis response regulator CheB
MTQVVASLPGMRPVRVLVIDDSALIRQVISEILAADPGIEVVGTASDPLIAREKIKQLNPDVLTLDIEMPRMDGLTFLRNLMRLRPIPVVMVSSLTERGADITFDAMAAGAVDFVTKPGLDVARGMLEYAELLRCKVRAAAHARVGRADLSGVVAPAGARGSRTTDRLVAIGASTGGTEAIRQVLAAMPADAPAVVIAQHIPAAFSAPFAERMDRHSAMTVVHAQDQQPILPGHAYIAPGGRHLRVHRSGARWVCRIGHDAAVNGHRPSVDVLFDSVAVHAGANAAAALLTGMGDDGARGLLRLRGAGATTFAQDRATSVIWGMPGAAVARGAVDEVVPLDAIAQRLLDATDRATVSAKPQATD